MRTGYVLMMMGSLAACAVTGTEGSLTELDDLAPYDQGTGGGKFDDPSCTDASYRAFLVDYSSGTAAADASPCKQGNDASFRIWAHLLGEKLKPLRDRYKAAIDATATAGATTAAQIETAGTLTSAERDDLAKLAAVRPLSTGLVGMAEWSTVHKDTLGSTMRPVQVEGGVQAARAITAFESEWLSIVEQSQPVLNEAGAWAPWWAANESRWTTLSSLALGAPALSATDTTFVARLGKGTPASTFDADAAAFQTTLMTPVKDAFVALSLSRPSGATFDLLQASLAMKPPGGGTAAYTAWADLMRKSVNALGLRSTLSSDEVKLMTILLSARPCADATAVATPLEDLQHALGRTGPILMPPAGTSLADRVAPTACP